MTFAPLRTLGHNDVKMPMIYTHMPNHGAAGVRSPMDGLVASGRLVDPDWKLKTIKAVFLSTGDRMRNLGSGSGLRRLFERGLWECPKINDRAMLQLILQRLIMLLFLHSVLHMRSTCFWTLPNVLVHNGCLMFRKTSPQLSMLESRFLVSA